MDLKLLAEQEDLQLNNARPLSGGDINEVQHLSCKEGEFVVKINDRNAYPKMFEREASGLDELRKANSFTIPEVIATGEIGEDAYLLMRYIDEASPSSDFEEQFAQKLAKMHQVSADHFGFMKIIISVNCLSTMIIRPQHLIFISSNAWNHRSKWLETVVLIFLLMTGFSIM